MAGLWVRSIFTVWKMSTTPSYRIRSSTMLSVMKTPVLPTPALWGEGQLRAGALGPQLPGHERGSDWTPEAEGHPPSALASPAGRWAGPGSSAPAVDGDGPVLAELLLGLVHLADEVNEALPRLRHALLRPVRELELPDGAGLAVLGRRRAHSLATEVLAVARPSPSRPVLPAHPED